MKSAYLIILIYIVGALCTSAQVNSPLPQSKEEKSIVLKLKVKTCSIEAFDVIDEQQKRTTGFDSTHYDVLGNIILEAYGWPREQGIFKNVTEYIYDGENRLISQKIAQYVGSNMQGPADCRIYEYDSKGNLIRECTPIMQKEQLAKEYCTVFIYANEKLVQKNTTEGNYLYQTKGDTIVMVTEEDNLVVERYLKDKLISRKFEDGSEYFYYYDKSGFMIQSQGKRVGMTESVTSFEYENGLLKRSTFKDGNLRTNSVEVYTYTFYP